MTQPKEIAMKRFFQSGLAFVLVALICFAAGLMSQSRTLFVTLGAFWLIVAIVVRSKKAKQA